MTDDELRAIVTAERLLAQYVHRVDEADGEGVGELFAEDATIEGLVDGEVLRGRAEIMKFFGERPIASPPRSHHVTSTDAHLDPDGTLRATTYMQVVGIGGLTCGWYDDEFAQEGGDWVFKRRRITVEVVQGAPR